MLLDRVTGAARGQHLRAPELPPHRRPAEVVGNGGGEAASETPFLVVRIMRDGQIDLFATGVYLDRCARRPRSEFAERIVVCDSSRFDTLLAMPL